MVYETRLYDLLEVEPIATDHELKIGYHKMAKKYHPDKNPTGTERIKDIVWAYSTLKDKTQRSVYDLFGEKGLERFNRGDLHEMDHQFRELKEVNGVRQIEYDMNVTLEELYLGSLRIVKVKTSVDCKVCKEENDYCEKCNGKKKLKKLHNVYIEIPLGAPDGYTLSYDLRYPTSQPIKLTVHLRELKHSIFKRNCDDLTIKVMVHVAEALTFFGKTIKSLDGRMLYIKTRNKADNKRSTIKDGQKMILNAEGMPHFEKPTKKGAMVITFCIKYPEYLTKHQIEVIKPCFVPPSSLACPPHTREVELVAIPDAEIHEMNEIFAGLFKPSD